MQKLNINCSGRNIVVEAKRVGSLRKGVGLMFRSRGSGNLLFDFKEDVRISITSLFVFFPFLIVWLDNKNRVSEFYVVKPFRWSLKPKKKFRRFVEIPLNDRNAKIIEFFVGKRRKV